MRLFSELQAGTVAGIHAYSIYMCISHHVHFSTCLISMKTKREYAGVVLIWIIRGGKASHATAQICIEHGKSNWNDWHCMQPLNHRPQQYHSLFSKAARLRRHLITHRRKKRAKETKKAEHGTQSCCRPWRPCIFLGEKELAAARSFKVLAESRCVKNRSVWLPLPAASLPLDQMQYAYLYLQG